MYTESSVALLDEAVALCGELEAQFVQLLGAHVVGACEFGVDAQLGLRGLQLRGQVGHELEAQLQAIANQPNRQRNKLYSSKIQGRTENRGRMRTSRIMGQKSSHT